MWYPLLESREATETYRRLREKYAKELMAQPLGDPFSMPVNRTCMVEPELGGKGAFWMLMADRGGELAICAPGHGSEVMRLALGAIQSKVSCVSAWVRADNKRALKLFRRFDFVEIGKHTRKYAGGEIDGIHFAKALW